MPNPLVSQIEIDNNVYDIKDAEARNKISELKLSDLKTDDNHQFVSKEEKEKWDSGSITIDDTLSDTSENPVQNKVIKGELDKVFQSVSDGKSKIASAITDKGVKTDKDATFDIMADNIKKINIKYFNEGYGIHLLQGKNEMIKDISTTDKSISFDSLFLYSIKYHSSPLYSELDNYKIEKPIDSTNPICMLFQINNTSYILSDTKDITEWWAIGMICGIKELDNKIKIVLISKKSECISFLYSIKKGIQSNIENNFSLVKYKGEDYTMNVITCNERYIEEQIYYNSIPLKGVFENMSNTELGLLLLNKYFNKEV